MFGPVVEAEQCVQFYFVVKVFFFNAYSFSYLYSNIYAESHLDIMKYEMQNILTVVSQ